MNEYDGHKSGGWNPSKNEQRRHSLPPPKKSLEEENADLKDEIEGLKTDAGIFKYEMAFLEAEKRDIESTVGKI